MLKPPPPTQQITSCWGGWGTTSTPVTTLTFCWGLLTCKYICKKSCFSRFCSSASWRRLLRRKEFLCLYIEDNSIRMKSKLPAEGAGSPSRHTQDALVISPEESGNNTFQRSMWHLASNSLAEPCQLCQGTLLFEWELNRISESGLKVVLLSITSMKHAHRGVPAYRIRK